MSKTEPNRRFGGVVDGSDIIEGISIREHFASQALQGLLSREDLDPESDLGKRRIAAMARNIADKLIFELNQTEHPHA